MRESVHGQNHIILLYFRIKKGRTEDTIFTLHSRNYGSKIQSSAKIIQLSESELNLRFSKIPVIFTKLRWTLVFLFLRLLKSFLSYTSITPLHYQLKHSSYAFFFFFFKFYYPTTTFKVKIRGSTERTDQ